MFDEALHYLLSLGHETLAIKLGLANTERLLAALGHPQSSFRCVQIAGTNGKGSTAVMLESICRAAGIRTGLYTSPHLISITERVRIAGREITREEFGRLTWRVRAVARRLLAAGELETLPTFFEHLTAIALLAFREAHVELAILETGMGGRLDATTAARAALVAITPVDLDHQEYLGETLAEIAAEKAAIIRPGVRVIVAPQAPAALEVILRRCDSCGVVPVLNECRATAQDDADSKGHMRVSFETARDSYENVRLGLRGRHQMTNACVAISLAEALREGGFDIPRAAVREGLEEARHAGRLELRAGPPALLFDGAHNRAGARALRSFLDEFVREEPLTMLFGAMRDKDLNEIAATLFPAADRLILTAPSNPRAATPEALARTAAPYLDADKISLAPLSADALEAAYGLTPAHGLICVTGSLYLVGEVSEVLQRAGKA